MTSVEWTAKKRAQRRKSGVCRCGSKRAPGRKSCAGCLDWESVRRAWLRKEGICYVCRVAPATVGSRCAECRDRVNREAREMRAMYRAQGKKK